jgi:predicted NodU family carbamoyl transferase
MAKILSLYLSHDGCMTYVENNKITFHTQIDRYSRLKHYSFISHNIINIIKKIDFDYLLISCAKDNSLLLWHDILTDNNHLAFKKYHLISYGIEHHHLFHAYCALTWNKNYENILICDAEGAQYKNDYERESLFYYKKNNLKHIFTENQKIGYYYQEAAKKKYNKMFQDGKLMALSLVEKNANKTQKEYENNMLSLIKEKKIKKNLLFSGGCAQNVIFNNKLLNYFDNVFCDPFNGDFGISLGAVNYFLNNKIKNNEIYLGIPQILNLDLFLKFKIKNVTKSEVAKILLSNVVAIFQSRSEQGQRGLGNRSLLTSPLNVNANSELNKIKKREWYRPFACSIIYEKTKEWFDLLQLDESPHMMFVFKLLENKKNILKSGVAINNTSRIQTVKKSQNLHFYDLIKEFEKITNVPILINTSLNLPGEVLVETLYDLKEMFINSELKYIYLPEINKMICK